MRQPGSIALVIAAATAAALACSKSVDAPPPAQSAARSTTAPANPDDPHHRNRDGKREDRHDPAAAPRLQLAVAIDGATASWGPDAFGKVAKYVKNDRASDGEAREVWSLRELAHTLVGPTARVTAVTGDDSKRIDRAAWDDAAHEPLLHTTRRGTLKFRWADADGTWDDAEVKDVTRIEIAP